MDEIIEKYSDVELKFVSYCKGEFKFSGTNGSVKITALYVGNMSRFGPETVYNICDFLGKYGRLKIIDGDVVYGWDGSQMKLF